MKRLQDVHLIEFDLSVMTREPNSTLRTEKQEPAVSDMEHYSRRLCCWLWLLETAAALQNSFFWLLAQVIHDAGSETSGQKGSSDTGRTNDSDGSEADTGDGQQVMPALPPAGSHFSFDFESNGPLLSLFFHVAFCL